MEREKYNPDSEDDYGRRRYFEMGGIGVSSKPVKDYVCVGHYQRMSSKDSYFVPDANREIITKYRKWSREYYSPSSKREYSSPEEPFIVFFDYTHNIFAIYYGLEGYCYSFTKDRADSKEKLLGWIYHLSKKRWFSRKHLFDLFRVWADVFNTHPDMNR